MPLSYMRVDHPVHQAAWHWLKLSQHPVLEDMVGQCHVGHHDLEQWCNMMQSKLGQA